MATADQGLASWLSATVDVILAVVGFVLVWYPMTSLGNAVLGSPVTASTVNLIVGVLALGGAYPVVAGDWSLGQLGEYVFVLLVAAIGWGLVGMLLVLTMGISLSGSNPVPQVVTWGVASLTAYVVVYEVDVTIFR